MIQTVTTAQELFAKAAIVDLEKLTAAQKSANLVAAENCLKDACSSDVRPAIREWAKSHGMPENQVAAFHSSGYLEQITPSATKAAFPPTRSSLCYVHARRPTCCISCQWLSGTDHGRSLRSQ